MFRTIILQKDVARGLLKKVIRATTFRAVTVEFTKRRQYHKGFLMGHDTGKLLLLRKSNAVEQILVRHYASYPPHKKVALPALSPTMEVGTIVSWHKKEGDKLSEGDLLAEIETDKATMPFDTPEEGYLAKIIIAEGVKDIPVGKLVCIIVENQADVAAFKDFKDDGAAPAAAKAPAAPAPAAAPAAPAPVAAPSAAPPPAAAHEAAAAGGRVYASPMAKKLAEKRNVRLQGKGSGLYGSITSADVPQTGAAAAPGPRPAAPSSKGHHIAPKPAPGVGAASAFVDIPVTGMRATIAKRLRESKQSIPHYYLSVTCNVDKLLALREKINKKNAKSGLRLSVNDFVIKAVATAALKVPEANSSWLDTKIRQHHHADVSLAVSTDRGLITPIVFRADSKGVTTISKNVKELAAKARDGKLAPPEYQGGTICVSNLGMYGVNQFCAIINPPQSVIVAVGTTIPRLIIDDTAKKGFREAQFLTATASCDHRTVDGAVGAQFLRVFKSYMEDPVTMII